MVRWGVGWPDTNGPQIIRLDFSFSIPVETTVTGEADLSLTVSIATDIYSFFLMVIHKVKANY